MIITRQQAINMLIKKHGEDIKRIGTAPYSKQTDVELQIDLDITFGENEYYLTNIF